MKTYLNSKIREILLSQEGVDMDEGDGNPSHEESQNIEGMGIQFNHLSYQPDLRRTF